MCLATKSCGPLLLALIGVSQAAAYEWPQWLGPNRDGLTEETGLLQDWPTDGPKKVWLFKDCGLGYAGPAVVGGKLFIMGSRDKTEELLCLDAETGEELWSVELGPEYENGWGNGPRGTPTIDGQWIYVLAAKGNLVCLSLADGSERWKVNLTEELGGQIPIWGYSESPLIDGDRVIVTPGVKQKAKPKDKKGETEAEEESEEPEEPLPGTAIVALNKRTGETLWQTTELSPVAHYSSVVAAEIHGQLQYVQLLVDQLVGVEPSTGELLWSVEWPGRVAVIPTPIVNGNQVFVTTGYGVGCMMVEISPANEATVVYQNKTMKNHHGGVLLLGDKLYGHSDKIGWLCLDFASGKRVWRERAELGKGAIAYADGRFYCQGEDDGQVVLIEASEEGWKEHGRFTLDPQTKLRSPKGKIWTHPVIVNGRMYLRDQELLFCFDISPE